MTPECTGGSPSAQEASGEPACASGRGQLRQKLQGRHSDRGPLPLSGCPGLGVGREQCWQVTCEGPPLDHVPRAPEVLVVCKDPQASWGEGGPPVCRTAEGRGSVGSVAAAHTGFWFLEHIPSKQSHLVAMESSEACGQPTWPAVEGRSGSAAVGGGQTR